MATSFEVIGDYTNSGFEINYGHKSWYDLGNGVLVLGNDLFTPPNSKVVDLEEFIDFNGHFFISCRNHSLITHDFYTEKKEHLRDAFRKLSYVFDNVQVVCHARILLQSVNGIVTERKIEDFYIDLSKEQLEEWTIP